MAAPDNTPRDFELPIRNVAGVQAGQAILAAIAELKTQVAELTNELRTQTAELKNEVEEIRTEVAEQSIEFRTRSTRTENSQRRLQNSLRLSTNLRTLLLPLLDTTSGLEIPNCPPTYAQIRRLSRAEATRILQALQVPVPLTVAAQRIAVQKQFLN